MTGNGGALRAVVTGGAGFIGSHVCRQLLMQGYQVICVDNFVTGSERNLRECLGDSGFHLVRHDASQSLLQLEIGDIDRVFHLASPASPPDYFRLPVETMLVNSEGTRHALELAHRHHARFLFTSTSEVYGDPLIHPQSETYWGNVNPNGVRSVYDEAKRFGEAMVMHYVRAEGVDARIVRVFNTYGPHSRPSDGRVVPNLLTQALEGAPLTIYGDGSQTRSFCYVSDLVSGILAAMDKEHLQGEVINLGNPDEYTINEFAAVIERIVGKELGRDYRTLPQDDPTRRRPDITKAAALLGWQPVVGLDEGLRQTASWFTELTVAREAVL